MADLLETIDDLTREKLLDLLKRRPLYIDLHQLLSLRYDTLMAVTHLLEVEVDVARATWLAAWEQQRQAIDASIAACKSTEAAWNRAQKAYIAAQIATKEARKARDRAEKKVERARAKMDACWAAWEKAAAE